MLDEARQTEFVSERTYQRIRADIVCGGLPPGDRLTLDRMREAYEVSVGTLRETLNRLSLSSEGLIVAEGSCGFQVAPISAADLREVAAMRCLLESHALRKSFETGHMEWEGHVVAAHHKLASMERRIGAGEHSQAQAWKRYDREFHRALISACGSQVLLTTHAVKRLLDCALQRDWKSAQSTLAKHVQDCVKDMVQKRLVV